MEAFERLEQLLLEKEYDELTVVDKQWLHQLGISASDYARQRDTLLVASEILQAGTITPPPSLQRRLLKQHRLRTAVRRRSVSALVGAIATSLMIGLLIGYWAFSQSAVSIQVISSEPQIETRTLTDTVFVEKLVFMEAEIIYRDRFLRDTIYLPAIASAPVHDDKPDILPTLDKEALPDFSRNARETESLLKVLVEVY